MASFSALCLQAAKHGMAMLTAKIELEDDWLRAIVVAAIERRSDWWTLVPQDSVSQQPVTFRWAEYELLDWQAVQDGESCMPSSRPGSRWQAY